MTKRIVPNVVRGGVALPLKGKTNYYYMRGRKHSTGGIDIGKNPRTGLEVEDGEVMHLTNNSVKVFSSVPFLNGKSPAQKVMGGENPNKVFKQQEEFKDRHKLNNDGSRKKAEWGLKEGSFADFITDMIPVVGTLKEATRLVRNPSWEQAGWTVASLASDITGGLIGKSIAKAAKATRAGRTIKRTSYFTHTKGIHKPIDVGVRGEKAIATTLQFPGDIGVQLIQHKNQKQDEIKDMNTMNKRNKYKTGGLYSLTANGRTKLMMFPSTGKVSGKRDKYVLGGNDDKKHPLNQIPEVVITAPRINSTANQIPEVVVTAPRINRTSPLPTPLIPTLKTNIVDIPDTYSRIYTSPKPSILDRAADIYGRVRDYAVNNPYVVGDGISLASNVISSIIGHRANSKMLDNLKYSSAPAMRRAVKLKTRININPQLDKMRESLAAYERDVNANTASSRVALARKQRARLANVMETNQLYADKENKETELINKDRLNQQSVADANIRDYNRWAQNKAAFDSAVLEKRAENDTALINNINAGIQDLITNRNKRDSEFRTLSALSLGSSPNLPAEMFYASGVWNKRMYDLYRKAYPLKGTKRGTDDSQNR